MRWPFGRTERRESSFTDALVNAAIARAGGATSASVGATGALQAASGMVSRAFAAATVQGPANLAAAVTPFVLSMIGRALMRRGEIVMVIDVSTDGRVRLAPAADWDVRGDWEPETWDYRVNLAGPSRYTTRVNVPAASVVHPRYEVDPEAPWRGVGPLQSATLAGRLSAETVGALADAEGGPRGSLMPLPTDGADETVTALKADLRTLAGKLAFVESVRTMHAGAAGNAPTGDWESKRIGANPPRAEVELLTRAGLEVVNACGASGLFSGGDGTGQRESYRRWLHGTVAPLGRIVAQELSAKLGADIALNFDALMAADVQGRARAWRSLAGPEAAMSPEIAARLAGLMEADA